MGILSLRLKCVSLFAIFVIVTVSFKLLSSLFFADYVYHQVKVENLQTESPNSMQVHIEVVRILYDCKSSKQNNRTKCHQLPHPRSISNNTSSFNSSHQHNAGHERTVAHQNAEKQPSNQISNAEQNRKRNVEECISYDLYSESSDKRTANSSVKSTDVMQGLKLEVKRIHVTESLYNRKRHKLLSSEEILVDDSIFDDPQLTENVNASFPTLFAITPTHRRLTQKVDLTSLCQTLMSVPQLVWIVVEDSDMKNVMVAQLLKHCRVQSVHLNIKTITKVWSIARGVPQRNMGLNWIRSSCHTLLEEQGVSCNGVVYFMDDDNKYDLRLFEEIRKTKGISVFPVAFAGGLKYEGPVCKHGRVLKWHRVFAKERKFPVDMAAFAINVRSILARPSVLMGYDRKGERVSELGFLETRFLEHFVVNRQSLECRGSNTEVYVWHVKVEAPELTNERIHRSDPRIAV